MELTKDQIDRLLKSDLANIVKKVLKGKPLTDFEIEHLKNAHKQDQTPAPDASNPSPEVPAARFPPWWEVFTDEYLKNGYNGTQAYLKARPNVTMGTAKAESCNLVKNPNFQQLLAKKRQKVTNKIDVDFNRWLEEMESLAFARVFKVDAGAKHKALETLGKITGIIQDKVEMRHTFSPVDVAVTLAGLTRMNDNGELQTIEINVEKLLEAEILDDDGQSSIP